MPDLLRATALAIVVGVGLSGCGGSSTPDRAVDAASQAPTPVGSTPTAAATLPAASGSSPSRGASSPAPVSQPSGAASRSPAGSPAPAASQSRIELDASLSSTCVTPGGSMTVTLRAARPNMNVIVNTRYPDGKDGQVYGGFDVNGRTDAAGNYALTWQVSKLAPTGEADTQIAAVDRSAYGNRKLPFTIARTCS